MKPSDWTAKQRGLMAKLLEECEAESRHYVESKKFRKRNYADVADIEVLVRQGFIQDKNYQYSVNPLCLLQIESDLAVKICNDADLLWKAYREVYLNSDNETAFLSSVAKASDVTMDDAQRALHYMMQTNWHRGYATPADGLYNSVEVGEEVLKYDSFSDYLKTLYDQHIDMLRQRGSFQAFGIVRATNPAQQNQPAVHEARLPPWTSELSLGVQELLVETFHAKEAGWNRLAAMGIRTLFDMFSNDALAGDAGVFKKKLDDMLREEHIAPTQQENLDAMVEAGHAAAHRGFNPTPDMVETMWSIALNALESFYVLKPKARKLKSDTPARTSGTKT